MSFVSMIRHSLDRLKYVLIILAGIGLIASFGLLIYRHYRLQQEFTQARPESQVPLGIDTEEAVRIMDKVRSLVVVPVGEEPTVARITDINRLSGQLFFTLAQNGDHVLVFQQARRAVLYRESENKIVEITTVNIAGTPTPGTQQEVAGAETTQPTATPLVTPVTARFTVFLLNGLGDNETLDEIKQQLAQEAPELRVVGEAVAKRTYATSSIVDIAGDKAGQVKDIGERLNMELSVYPDGEDSFSADFLIVVGLDRK